MKHLFLLGVAGSALMVTPAIAQEAAAQQSAPTAEGQAAQTTAEADQVQDAAGQDIIVTAQRREENVQKIPVAVSVVGGSALERTNATDVSDMAKLVPSVTFSAGNELRNNSIRIRGVGTDVFSTGVEASVSTVVDGVVLQRPGSAFSDLGDIERVEVLRGPQGTLFGKNSSAGVINVITKAPNFSRFEGNVSALVAEDNEYRLNGAVSGPLGDQAAFRLAGFYRTQDGISRNLFDGQDINGQKAWGVRAKLEVRPTETLRMLVQADFSKLNANCCALPLRIASNNPRTLPTGTNVGPNNRDVNNDVNPFVKQKNYGASFTADLELGAFTLTSISAYREFENLSDVDLDDTQARFVPSNFNIETSRTTTQEFRLTSPKSETLDYVVGLYYFGGSAYNFLDRRGLNIGAVATINPDGTIVPTIPGDQARLTGSSTVDVTNLSAFGQANLHLGNKLTLTGGLRYLDEKQRLRFLRPVSGFFNGAGAAATTQLLARQTVATATTR